MNVKNEVHQVIMNFGGCRVTTGAVDKLARFVMLNKENKKFWFAIDKNGSLFVYTEAPTISDATDGIWTNEKETQKYALVDQLEVTWDAENEWQHRRIAFTRKQMLNKLGLDK